MTHFFLIRYRRGPRMTPPPLSPLFCRSSHEELPPFYGSNLSGASFCPSKLGWESWCNIQVTCAGRYFHGLLLHISLAVSTPSAVIVGMNTSPTLFSPLSNKGVILHISTYWLHKDWDGYWFDGAVYSRLFCDE